MTEKELARFNRGNELKKDIDSLERQIEKIENDFKTTYLNIDGCLELATVHYECDKKLKEMEAKSHE